MTSTTVSPSLHGSIKSIQNELNFSYFERTDAIEVFLLSLLAGQHSMLVGPPGTAKSALAREIAGRITGASYFETLLSRTRPAEAVLGPLDLMKLKNGVFQRKSEGFLPTVDLAFIDEFGQAGPTLATDLLAIMNERMIHEVDETGRSARQVPLSTIWAAGNDIPEEGTESAPAWDRILLRAEVKYIQANRSFAKLANMPVTKTRTTVDWESLKNEIDNVIPTVTLGDDVLALIIQLKEKLGKLDSPIHLSDRRWRDSFKVLKAAAWLDGRAQVTATDLLTYRYMAWSDLADIKHAERCVLSIADKITEGIKVMMDDISKIDKTIMERKDKGQDERGSHARSVFRKLKPLAQDILKMSIEHPGHKDISALKSAYEKAWSNVFTVLMDSEPVAVNW